MVYEAKAYFQGGLGNKVIIAILELLDKAYKQPLKF
jgi:hypothetical protein